VAKAPGFIFIAGGIGITPILSMMRTLEADGGSKYKCYYASRSPAEAAFREELMAPPFKGKVVIHHDHSDPEKFLDLWPVLEKPNGWHVYCCGPRALMENVRDMTGHWSSATVHFEDFGGDRGKAKPDDTSFRIRIAGTGQTIDVPPGMTALDALRLAGVRVPASCESGTCGSCKTKVVAGAPDHRDLVLADHEKADHMMVCVSRALSDELVLDL
jgi:phthalate 4,5-dioxygenase reductase subunit